MSVPPTAPHGLYCPDGSGRIYVWRLSQDTKLCANCERPLEEHLRDVSDLEAVGIVGCYCEPRQEEDVCTDPPADTCADPACPAHGDIDKLMTEKQVLEEGL